MNLTLMEAEAIIRKHLYLLGYRKFNNKITDLAIVPTKKDLVTEIANCLIDKKDYMPLLSDFTSFDVIVFYDLKKLLSTGLLIWDYLETVLEKIDLGECSK